MTTSLGAGFLPLGYLPKTYNKDTLMLVTIRQTALRTLTFLLLMQASATVLAAEGGVAYRVAWDADAARYRVYLRPSSTPSPDLSLTAQVTLRVPHATGTNQFRITDIQSKPGTAWSLGSHVMAPSENPAIDYLSFVFIPVDVKAFAFKAGEEQEAFSFKNAGSCLGNVELMDNATDPFNQPPANPKNSTHTNPNNQFANTGWGSTDDNDYLGNYGGAASCALDCTASPPAPVANSVYYRVGWSNVDQRYHVYLYPGSVPSPNMSLTSQVTLKMPHVTGSDSFKVTGLTSAISDIIWTESSRVDAPSEDTSADYLSFTMIPSNPQGFKWELGNELEVFSFANAGACAGAISLLDNAHDPFNNQPNSMDTNPGNQFSNLGWGSSSDNNYASNYGCPAVCIDVNKDTDNDGLTDAQEAELGTDPNKPDTDNDTLQDGEEVIRGGNPLKADVIRLQARLLLQGAYDSNSQRMRDTLRTKKLIPTTAPYPTTTLPNTGSQRAASTLLDTSGADAPVDWVRLELHDASNPAIRKASVTGLIQRDGDIMDAQTGGTTFLLVGVEPGHYYLSAHHRNHLGAMSAAAIALGATPIMVDFSEETTSTYGDHARFLSGKKAMLWAGNTNANEYLIAQGPSNDAGSILSNVLLAKENSAYTTNYKLSGYQATDTNMDGLSIFAGPANDVDLLLGNVLLHPVNSTFSANYIVRQQLP
jgi:hypothetical protein